MLTTQLWLQAPIRGGVHTSALYGKVMKLYKNLFPVPYIITEREVGSCCLPSENYWSQLYFKITFLTGLQFYIPAKDFPL